MTPGYIFDLDGTLLDTLDSLANSFNRVLKAFGHPPHPVESYRYFVGDGLRACVERCLPEGALTEETVLRFMEAQQVDYAATWDTAAPYDGVIDLVDDLVRQGAQLAVLSNKNHEFTVRCIEHYFPGRFEIVQGFSGQFPHKPDPAGARWVCDSLGLAPANVSFVGDTATDIRTAVACGNVAVGVPWGFRDADELTSAGAHRLIGSPAQLMEEP